MYNAFLYVVSNDGVDSAENYPFKGKVRTLFSPLVHDKLGPQKTFLQLSIVPAMRPHPEMKHFNRLKLRSQVLL